MLDALVDKRRAEELRLAVRSGKPIEFRKSKPGGEGITNLKGPEDVVRPSEEWIGSELSLVDGSPMCTVWGRRPPAGRSPEYTKIIISIGWEGCCQGEVGGYFVNVDGHGARADYRISSGGREIYKGSVPAMEGTMEDDQDTGKRLRMTPITQGGKAAVRISVEDMYAEND